MDQPVALHFGIVVQKYQIPPVGRFGAAIAGCGKTQILFIYNDFDTRIFLMQGAQEIRRTIGGRIINQHQLIRGINRVPDERFDTALRVFKLIIKGNDHRYQGSAKITVQRCRLAIARGCFFHGFHFTLQVLQMPLLIVDQRPPALHVAAILFIDCFC